MYAAAHAQSTAILRKQKDQMVDRFKRQIQRLDTESLKVELFLQQEQYGTTSVVADREMRLLHL